MTKKVTRIVGFIALAVLLSTALAPQADAGVGGMQIERRSSVVYEPIEASETANVNWIHNLLLTLTRYL